MLYGLSISSALLTLAALLPSTPALAQTTQSEPSSEVWPCDEFGRSARPTLRRRDRSASSTSGTVEQKQVEFKCKTLEDRSDQQTVELRFVGLKTLRESDVTSFFFEEGVKLRRDRIPDNETVDRATAALKKLLTSKGHVYAIVSVFRDEELKSITFQITEGDRLSLADIHFEDTKVFSADELKAITRGCLSKLEKSEDGYDQELLEYCQRNAETFIRNRGTSKQRLGNPRLISSVIA